MKIIQLAPHPEKYSCRSYLILGDWNGLDDVNTLIDPGIDGSIISQIEKVYTGVGKKPVDLVVLTHNHFDHAGGAAEVKKRFNARVVAFAKGDEVDTLCNNGEMLRFGDRYFEVIHMPAHSDDSVCFYCHDEKVVFTGDNALRVMGPENSYRRNYLEFLQRLAALGVQKAYGGHECFTEGGLDNILAASIANVGKALKGSGN